MSWCATTACTRGTWPSCSLPSEQREEEEDEEAEEDEEDEEADNMLCQAASGESRRSLVSMVPCQTVVSPADASLCQPT